MARSILFRAADAAVELASYRALHGADGSWPRFAPAEVRSTRQSAVSGEGADAGETKVMDASGDARIAPAGEEEVVADGLVASVHAPLREMHGVPRAFDVLRMDHPVLARVAWALATSASGAADEGGPALVADCAGALARLGEPTNALVAALGPVR
jgi:hypothetical protein